MLSWAVLSAIAQSVWRRYQALRLLVEGGTASGEPLSGFPPGSPEFPSDLGASEGLVVRFTEGDLDDWSIRWFQEDGDLDYWVEVDVLRQVDEQRLALWQFSSRVGWGEGPELSRDERRAAQKRLRQVEQRLRPLIERLQRGDVLSPEERARWIKDLQEYSHWAERLRGYQTRTGRHQKRERWAWQAGDLRTWAELLYPGLPEDEAMRRTAPLDPIRTLEARRLAPIALWPQTDWRTIAVKMGLLATRLKVTDDKLNAPLVSAVGRLLRLGYSDRSSDLATDVVGRAAVNYVGDPSNRSFSLFLHHVLRDVKQRNYGGRESLVPGTWEDAEDEDTRTPGRRVVAPVRLPGDELPTHPWTRGEPALLARLAQDFEIHPNVAYRWLLKTTSGNRVHEEVTASGKRFKGRTFVAPAERVAWEDLCVRYHEKHLRKAQTENAEDPEKVRLKKRAYRAALEPGGARDRARHRVAALAREAGL